MSAHLLGEACDVLDDAVDLEVALGAVARLTVPALADFCAIDILSPTGALARVAMPRDGGQPWSPGVAGWFPADTEGEHPIARVLREGSPELVPDVPAVPDRAANRRLDGEPAPHSYLVVPLMARGRRLGVLSLVSWTAARHYRADDLALAGRLARQLALAVDNRQLCEEIREFLDALSHELRTPLTAMLGWVTLLRRHDLSAAQMNRGLDVLERNTRLQARLLDDLLELTRLRSGAAAFERRTVDIVAVVRDALMSAAAEAGAKSIQTHVAFDPRGGGVVGDPARLRQLVASVMSTAIAETPTGGDIAVMLTRPTEAAVSLTVRSGRSALPPATAIEPRASVGGDRAAGGLGVALILARRLVELHEGRLWIDRQRPEMGCALRVDLPVRRPTSSEEPAAPARGDSPETGLAALRGRRVLVIEDDGDTREFLRLSLEHRGAIVRVAGSGAEALRLLDRNPVDVVLSDLMLPEGDGYSVIHAIRARGMTRVPAIALSALSGPAERERSAAAGFTEHLAKPIDPEQLARCLARVVREAEA